MQVCYRLQVAGGSYQRNETHTFQSYGVGVTEPRLDCSQGRGHGDQGKTFKTPREKRGPAPPDRSGLFF